MSNDARGWVGMPGALLFAGAILVMSPNAARSEALPQGEIVERVSCRDDASQSYALYLPRDYSSARPWPVLYAFDPAGQGSRPVRLFREAAERLGFVVAGSNNSRNGPLEAMHAAARAMLKDTLARLSLDPKRIYSTGMSGGTWPALGIAITYGAGVIACASPVDVPALPETFHVDWLGIAGAWDFNAGHTRSMVDAVNRRGGVARLLTFEGGHSWPPPEVAGEALEWLALRAVQSRAAPANDALVASSSEKGRQRARAFVAQGALHDAADEYAALARELAGLEPVEALAAEATRLEATPEARASRESEQLLERRFQAQIQQLTRLRSLVVGPPTVTAQRSRLEHRIALLHRDGDGPDRQARLLALRLLSWLYGDTLASGLEARALGLHDAALMDFDICARIRPEDSEPVYQTASTLAAQGQWERAVAQARKAIELGFGDVQRLENDAAWGTARNRDDFQGLIRMLRSGG